ncbi:hypothetical protein O3P69_018774 [Scylla paramamosain]|uniref:Uncharacterized protein n=1 Tax=Scylla paramamosain TaxID=85552 RepID=A0AAW0SUV4_SCYPA
MTPPDITTYTGPPLDGSRTSRLASVTPDEAGIYSCWLAPTPCYTLPHLFQGYRALPTALNKGLPSNFGMVCGWWCQVGRVPAAGRAAGQQQVAAGGAAAAGGGGGGEGEEEGR